MLTNDIYLKPMHTKRVVSRVAVMGVMDEGSHMHHRSTYLADLLPSEGSVLICK